MVFDKNFLDCFLKDTLVAMATRVLQGIPFFEHLKNSFMQVSLPIGIRGEAAVNTENTVSQKQVN